MAGVVYEQIVKEDLDLGNSTATRTMPGGGTAVGTQINIGTFQDTVGVAFATLPAASVAKGRIAIVNDSSTATAGATITGGGANFVLAFSNGVNWLVVR